ncbi:MAG TPA: DUF4199 domain-containing protein [Pyrinomonadaceae bacterium]|nr:DUF4199 domain-containing protein [Pyrinomonadaceae bacterium]
MKKIVLTYGLISGAIAALLMFATIRFVGRLSYEYLTILGYTIFVVSFLMVFFGIRAYRDNVAGGTITFGKGFKVGLLITLISCAIYIVCWEIISKYFLPGFFAQYLAYTIEQLRAAGAPPEEITLQMQENEKFLGWYQNPLMRFVFSFMEAFPVGLLITLISAAILRRKAKIGEARSA